MGDGNYDRPKVLPVVWGDAVKIVHATTYTVERVTVREAKTRLNWITMILPDDLQTVIHRFDYVPADLWYRRRLDSYVYLVLDEQTTCELVEDK